MILYTISGVIPHNDIKQTKLEGLEKEILEKIKKTNPVCQELNNPCCAEDIVLTFDSDGIYYQLDIEA